MPMAAVYQEALRVLYLCSRAADKRLAPKGLRLNAAMFSAAGKDESHPVPFLHLHGVQSY